MTLEDFISKWTGKVCDYDGCFGTQCVDLMNYYALEVLGMSKEEISSSLAGDTAFNIYFNGRWVKFFTRTENSPVNVPKNGDILFFGNKIGVAGHVCIVISANILTFKSFDANWPTGSLPHIQVHNYNGVLGWIRFIPDEPTPAPSPIVSKYETAYNKIKTIIYDTEA
jgi:hypothetical protein